MQQEIEVKFLNVDFQDVRTKLKLIGATMEMPMRLMRRVVIDYPDKRMQKSDDGWVRIRDEGDKVTLTYKTTKEYEFAGAQEIEVAVSDYQKTIAIFEAMGLVVHTDQETKRETWRIGDTEIVLDEWPWLNPYIEVEGASKESVKEVSGQLGFDWEDAVFGSVVAAYKSQYPNIESEGDVSMIPEIRFDLPAPAWFLDGKK